MAGRKQLKLNKNGIRILPATRPRADELEGYCRICRLPIPTWAFPNHRSLRRSVDHVKPLSLGGTSERANLAASHQYCNHRKGSIFPVPDWLRKECRERIHFELKADFRTSTAMLKRANSIVRRANESEKKEEKSA